MYPAAYRADSGLIQALTKAINGEYGAILCYEQLAKMAPNEEERKQILEIRNDEIKHFHAFSHLYTALTGKQPVPQIMESCPTSYVPGLHFAFKD
ncbi:MAG: YhjR [Paenibacillus sp.]|nr:YhjR [Paenibacillus sp.]